MNTTASHVYNLWVNGAWVLSGPARAFPRYRFLDRLDITRWLKPGANTIAAVVLPPTGVTGYSCPTRTGFFLAGEITGTDGHARAFGSGEGWRTCVADWIDSHGFLTSLPTGHQEHWDLAGEPENWLTAKDDTLDSDKWRPARLLGGAGTPPWDFLRERPVPLLAVEHLHARHVWSGQDDRGMEPGGNLCHRFPERMRNASRVEQTWDGISPLENREVNLWVFDLGKTRPLRAGIRVVDVSGNVRLEFFYDLAFDGKPSVMSGFHGEQEGFCDSMIPVRGGDVWQTLQPRGCRFVTIRAAGPGRCRFIPQFNGSEYPWPAKVRFECERSDFTKYWQMSAESLRSCSSDVIVDTCARENVLWTFDACVSGKASFYTFGDARLWRHCLWLIGEGIDGNGIPSSVVPAQASFMVLFDHAFQWVSSCRDYYLMTADRDFWPEVRQPLARFLAQCERHYVEDIFVPPAFAWHWMDWAPLDRRPFSLPVNAASLHALAAAEWLANENDDTEVAALAARRKRLLQAAIERFYDPLAGLWRDHLEPTVNPGSHNTFGHIPAGQTLTHSLHGNLQMAAFLEEKRRDVLLKNVARWLTTAGASRASMGPGWWQLLLQPLVANGYASDAIACLDETCGRQAATGSPTWAEGATPSEFNTAHAWGASVNSLIVEGFLGIQPAVPGWANVRCTPRIKEDFLYQIETVSGLIEISQSAGKLDVNLPSCLTSGQ
ncbi:hypothetical protein OPIT5_30155 [Opitutaceae bacterium TAV5]|nr:hypothetical protein OPIT5_30155 [Opitutaceae bacterium TAV5]